MGIVLKEKVEIADICFKPYRPSGYTDDLGIIADRNQWIPTQISGWYVMVSYGIQTLISWLQENNIDFLCEEPYILILKKKEDALLCQMTWM